MKFNVYTYDVWGNEENGFEVNDKSFFASVDINPTDSDEAIMNSLKGIGLLKDSVTLDMLDFSDSDDEIIYVNEADSLRPFCELLKA